MKNTSPKFSIITPVHLWNDNRVKMFLETINSVKNQTFTDFEWVIVDDGSTVPFDWNIVKKLPFPVTIVHKPHEERVIAYNSAFKEAIGQWFVLLDSDDELPQNALQIMNEEIKANKKAKMFNFACLYNHKDGAATSRSPFTPNRKEVGHEQFGGGNIVNGTFIWHRSVYKKLGAYPKSVLKNIDCSEINYGKEKRDLFMGTPYDFSAAAQLEFPEIREYFMVDHENEPEKILKELGNPWGQDYYLFYKYTRKYHSIPVDRFTYIVNPR